LEIADKKALEMSINRKNKRRGVGEREESEELRKIKTFIELE
jgi:hypothetical protein